MRGTLCNKCNCKIVPQEKRISGGRAYYVCPVCGVTLSTFKVKYVFIALASAFILWAVQFFYYHSLNGNLKWTPEIKASVFYFIVYTCLGVFVTLKGIKLKKESPNIVGEKLIKKPITFFTIGALCILVLVYEIIKVAKSVWGL
ncbi:hypothetical protein [Pseudoalteromonas denitrificans]|uniref:Uncharacterized protein n=1 Tax=Pseudoalteromonas denitrificans DSM 6059 TaxID=1123010 RepID=A0A1I1K7L5_9GAMM|nr:hypothetical protein [Pseudoalteromonas denitrificans]SFC56977.1 hypothetical protein SAMN02745724_01982 [Pseudoalteromonas denitrificans DSM 6059]